MILSGGGFSRTWLTRRMLPLLVLAAGALVVVPPLAAAGPLGSHLVRVLGAAVALSLVVSGWRVAVDRERRVRGWITLALAVWLFAESARVAAILAGRSPAVADLAVLGLGIASIGIYIGSAHGRMRAAEETALYLDATAVALGIITAVTVLGAALMPATVPIGILVHVAFLFAILAANILLNLTTRVPLRLTGPWESLVGVALGAVGYLGLLLPNIGDPVVAVSNVLIAAGAVVAGHGGARWATAQDDSPAYAAIASSLRAMLPVGSALLTGAVGVMLITRPDIVDGPMRIAVGTAIGFVAVAVVARQTLLLIDRERVLSRERELADELIVAEMQYRDVVERVPGVVYVAEVGQHGRWHFVSPKIEQLVGYTPEEWTADPTLWLSRMHPADRDRMIIAETHDHERSAAIGRWEYRLIARDGRVVWVIDDEAVVARDPDGHPTMVQGILVDISDRKDLEDQLRHQALHDPLTALPNRVLFVDRLSHALIRRGRPDTGLAVLFVDLDEFKDINDTLGHAAGDELLRLVGARLSGVIRAQDTACRLGGDEFAFLLEDVDPGLAEEAAQRILVALGEPFDLGGRSVTLSASVGIAFRNRLGEDGNAAEAADALLRDADTAMYAAKSLGKGRVRLFHSSLNEPIARRRELRNALERAIDTGELFLEYQPIVDLRTGLSFGLEALVRWNHPQLGRLMPADFVPLAEESGLIGALGDWVLAHAAADLARSSQIASINVSAHQLGHAELPPRVADVLRRTGLPANRLLLELTESTLASAGAGAETELEAIRALGVRIALDDFGSGYSSLEYLGRLPVDILKVDRSLIEHVHHESQRQEVLRAIGHIADKLNLETIVEGVELEAQRITLLDLGFNHAQGFLFSPAVPLAEALARWEVRRAS